MMIVYNPRSSHFGRVRDEVLAVSRELSGWTVGKFEVAPTDVDDNAERLAGLLNDGDLVVSAGGDGTATIALNGVMLSRAKEVKLGVLSYGNFNDTVRTLGKSSFAEIVEGKTTKVWPLECLVNGEHFRWGMGYFTVGLFAEACAVFDQKDNRRELRTGEKGMIYSIWLLKKWYFKNRKRGFLGGFMLERGGEKRHFEGMTDYVAVNGRSMARVMRGGRWFLDKNKFLSETRSLQSFWGLGRLMVRSMVARIPGEETSRDVLVFDEPGKVMVQGEGEYRKFEGVKSLEFRKTERPVTVVMK